MNRLILALVMCLVLGCCRRGGQHQHGVERGTHESKGSR